MKIQENDSVIIYYDEDNIEIVKLIKDKQIKNKRGIFLHNDIIGKEYGIKIYDSLKKNFIYVLKRSQELIALSLKKNTQVLFEHDISFICLLCNAIPNKKIVEAGTGSGCLTYALANSVYPNGKIYTFEYNEERYKCVKEQFQNFHNLKNIIHFYHRDIINSDFDESINDIDSVFLDLPNPWLCVNQIKKILKERGLFVIFLPCIEQVHKMVDALEENFFSETVTYELLNKTWKIEKIKKKKQKEDIINKTENIDIVKQNNENYSEEDQNGFKKIYNINENDHFFKNNLYKLLQKENKTHTGYIIVTKKPLNDEYEQMELDLNYFIN